MSKQQVHDLTAFYCSRCGSDRVAGQTLVPLNYKVDSHGNEYPTVTQTDLDAARARAASPGTYQYFCVDCNDFGTQLLDDQSMIRNNKITLS